MSSRTRGALAALAFAFTSAVAVPGAIAQSQPPAQSDPDHKTHHPDDKAPGTKVTPTPPAAPSPQMGGMNQGGMMCGEMMSMMRDMHAMMSAHAGMMGARVEATVVKLRADLKITDAQAAQWNRFADAVRASAKAMDAAHEQMMKPASGSLPDRLARQDERMSAHLKSMQAITQALVALYAVLSDEQKKIADGVRIGPMGVI